MKLKMAGMTLTAVLLASSCGSVQNAADNIGARVSASEVQHKWTEERCNAPLAMKLLGGSVKKTYEFSGDSVTRTDQFFSDSNCTNLAANVMYNGNFDKKDKISDNVYQINLNYNQVVVLPLNDAGRDLMNNVKLCGHTDWQTNAAVDLTGNSRDALCPLDNTPETVFDIYTVENNVMFFGKNSGTTADKRSGDLDRDEPYQRQ